MKHVKISKKLQTGIAGQLIFIGLLLFFIFSLIARLNRVSEETLKTSSQINEVIDLTAKSKDYINDKLDFNELEALYTKELEEAGQDDLTQAVDIMWTRLKKIERLKSGNRDIEQKVTELTETSLKQSNAYIYAMSEKLAHPTERARVTTLERAVIGGANNNNNNLFRLRVNFLKLKKDISVKDEIIPMLEDFISQADKDVERLKNTPFAQLPVKAKESNEMALDLIHGYIQNTEEIDNLETDLYATVDAITNTLMEKGNNTLVNNFGDIKTTLRTVFLILLVISVVLILMNFSVSVTITRLFKQLVKDLGKLAQGDLAITPTKGYETRKDEVGDLSRATLELVNNLDRIIGDIRNGAESIAGASQQISSGSQQLSSGASQQASSVEEVSATMEEMSSNIEQNKDNAQSTESISLNAQAGMSEVAERASKALEATREIADKIQIINDIAFQTNILALNAAVEAARAGEHGKGFAVVAAEVRKLAERSKLAAEEIVSLAQESYNLAEGAGKRMMETLPEVENTTKLVQEIAAASSEQSNGVNQVNSALQQLNSITQQNAASSEELATSAEELSGQADALRDLVAYFRIRTEQVKLSKNVKTEFKATPKDGSLEKKVPGVATPAQSKVQKSATVIDNEFESF